MAVGDTTFYRRADNSGINYTNLPATGNDSGMLAGGWANLGGKQQYIDSIKQDIEGQKQTLASLTPSGDGRYVVLDKREDGSTRGESPYFGQDPNSVIKTLQSKLDEVQGGQGVFADNYNNGAQVINGNYTEKPAIDAEAQHQANVKNGTEKVAQTVNGVNIYQPAQGAAPFQQGSIPGSDPGQVTNGSQTSQNATGQAQSNGQTQSSAIPQSSYTGPSIIDYVNSIGGDSSMAGRQQLAQQYGVQNYDFSSGKNTELLDKMRSAHAGANGASSTPVSANPQKSAPSSLDGSQQSELDRTIEVYSQIYNKLGLGDIKAQAQKYQDDLKKVEDKKNQEIQGVNNNPWLSEGVRIKSVENVTNKYKSEVDTLTNLEKLYSSLFEKGQTEVNSIAGHVETNMTNALNLAQKQHESATAIMKENQIVQSGGQYVLINKVTKKVTPLGVPTPIKKSSNSKDTGEQAP